MSTPLRTYFNGPNGPVCMIDHRNNQKRYFHYDHQGTVQCLTDETGAVTDRFASDAWGAQVKRTGTSINRQWYIGRSGYYRHVDQALDYVRARYLKPAAGRWLRKDPAGFFAGDNLYQYVLNRPALITDPSGAEPFEIDFNAFIHKKLNGRNGPWLPEPANPFYFFKGDNRGFGGQGTARLRCRATVDSLTLDVSGAKCYCSPSHRLYYNPQTQEFREWVKTAKADWSVEIKKDLSQGNFVPCAVTVTFKAAAAYPFLPSPTIDIKVTWRIRVWSRNELNIQLEGRHDLFPFYEGVVGVETIDRGQRYQVYTYESPFKGPDALNLNNSIDFAPRSGCIKAHVPEECCGPGQKCAPLARI